MSCLGVPPTLWDRNHLSLCWWSRVTLSVVPLSDLPDPEVQPALNLHDSLLDLT